MSSLSVVCVQTQMSGQLPAEFPVNFRMDSGLQYRTATVDGSEGVTSKYRPQYSLPAFNVTTDLSGGFYEDGPWGPVKLTKSNALATANLAWSVMDLPGPYERDPKLMVLTLFLELAVACSTSLLPAFKPVTFLETARPPQKLVPYYRITCCNS
jgi:hypothetical protein